MKVFSATVFPIIALLTSTALGRVHNQIGPRQEVPSPGTPPSPEPVPPSPPSSPPVDPSVPALPVPPPPAPAPAPIDPNPGPDPIPVPAPPPSSPVPFSGPNCGKGYTYCGYMLTNNGHNFTPEQISQAYCDGLTDHCNGSPATASKTNVAQAVFVCLDDAPKSTVKLLCACSGECTNDPATNNIAQCNDACWN
ncbi:uncharacterized protein B0I36DRAFT_348604 [Microdochium trichocladiopsis]|uniref:Uncharacterized protein n=1 Tax=Microdochium trichocladiopsis TaxID=1682393 RepID=A0A9P9BS77_9PEZI|nr:uncharacterized protein B0I36DRAFT_348604 [Microdochium trichocladiopsis]KAH7033565.1 hypothetical protein B0I36DRAFT_348604 [Microdochium trichocladiopsis]